MAWCAEADPTGTADDPSSSPLERAIRTLVACASQSGLLAAGAGAAAAPAASGLDDATDNPAPDPRPGARCNTAPLPPGEGGDDGNRPDAQQSDRQSYVSQDSDDRRVGGDAPSPLPSPGEGGGAGTSARFESLEGLYQRLAASAAGGRSDEQATQACVETARNTSLILEALEAQNRLPENARGQQPQQILWAIEGADTWSSGGKPTVRRPRISAIGGSTCR